jgi:DNA/RNA-binding domain of Phe-tRNA-synthetase-like protein
LEAPVLHYRVDSRIFERFPGYSRGVVIASDVKNGDSPDELVSMLRDAEAALRARLNIDTLAEHPRIESWRRAFREFGARPSEFRSSIEALARRVLRGEPIRSISRLVDIGTVVSLAHLLPVGAHAIDVVTQDIALRPATGDEEFVPLGSQEMERPLPGEVIFVEGNRVLTRRWTWRQASHTATLPETRDVEFNVDGLPPVPAPEVEAVCQEVIELVKRFCGGQARYEVLSRENPSIRLKPVVSLSNL